MEPSKETLEAAREEVSRTWAFWRWCRILGLAFVRTRSGGLPLIGVEAESEESWSRSLWLFEVRPGQIFYGPLKRDYAMETLSRQETPS